MAWGFIQELPLTVDQYDQLNNEITEEPEGLILHTSSEKAGGVRIVDFWDSEDAYRRFERETLMPAIDRIGVAPPAEPPAMDTFEVHNMRGRAS